jgi:hypothetical protein
MDYLWTTPKFRGILAAAPRLRSLCLLGEIVDPWTDLEPMQIAPLIAVSVHFVSSNLTDVSRTIMVLIAPIFGSITLRRASEFITSILRPQRP